jgi:3-hydroxyisobutyrate dehydrogenase-like beta-hydroxyacid dehydrogenase
MGERRESAAFVIGRVGVIGLGHMGHAFAANLVEDGSQVLVYDPAPERIATLLPMGARGVAGLADLATCDVVVTSLPDDDPCLRRARTRRFGRHFSPSMRSTS